MNDLPQIQTVKLLFINLDEQQQAMFKMAFKMHSATNYCVIDETDADKPDLVIVDGDNALSLDAFQAAKKAHANSVVVFFAKNPPTITAPYLAKPIKFNSLFVNLRNLLQGNGVHVAAQAVEAATAALQGQTSTHTASHLVSNVQTPQPAKRTEETVIQCFDPSQGLLGAFRDIVAKQKDAQILVDGQPVLFIFPAILRVWVPIDSAQLKHLCQQDALEVKTELLDNKELYERANATITSTLWQIALWTANGRLIQPFKPDTVFRLERWPNLPRLAPLPESLRLSAFLTKTPINLNMLYKLMPSLDMADIANYIAATYLTDYLVITQQPQNTAARSMQAKINTSGTLKQEEIQAAKPTREYSGGLLSRLMKKLLK